PAKIRAAQISPREIDARQRTILKPAAMPQFFQRRQRDYVEIAAELLQQAFFEQALFAALRQEIEHKHRSTQTERLAEQVSVIAAVICKQDAADHNAERNKGNAPQNLVQRAVFAVDLLDFFPAIRDVILCHGDLQQVTIAQFDVRKSLNW